ncbi:MAG: ThiF family adenylyltransferase [Blautia sp.]|nr:ThiF family adenylyltransferase [Blautia sp.]
MINPNSIYKIKDSVDLFLTDDKFITAYFMNTRQRSSFRVNSTMVALLETINGVLTVDEICQRMFLDHSVSKESVITVMNTLQEKRIITEIRNVQNILNDEDMCRYARQINYFSEFCGSEEEGCIAQKKVSSAKVLILGCGAIGGNIAIELVMAGVQNITLFDYDSVCESDCSRHLYYRKEYLGLKKVEALKSELIRINRHVIVNAIDMVLMPQTDIEDLIENHDFVINTLDEPYIGYTSSKISRICMKHQIPHYIAGGFDAHLASTGELIIPYVTPCVECYANHFKESLKGWKPLKHPTVRRDEEIGGLSSMSLFSSSYACIEILKVLAGIVNQTENYKIRGEFLFQDFSLTYLDVKRDPECPICGGDHK